MEKEFHQGKENFYLQDHFLSMALESVAECVSITDENNIIFYVNRAFLKTYGYEYHEVIGQHINMFRKEPFEQSMDLILEKTIEGGWKGEVINLRKNREEFPVLLSTSIITDHDGTYLGLIGVASDITQTKKAEETYRVLVDNSIQGLILIVDNLLFFSNTRASEILGFTTAELGAWQLTDFVSIFHPMERKFLQDIFKQLVEQQKTEFNAEFRIITRDHEQKWIQLSASKISFMNELALHLAFIDITSKKSAELGFHRIHQQVHNQNIVIEELLQSDLSDFNGTMAKIVETAADNINVDLVSIWLFNQDETLLECIEQYNRLTHRHNHGMLIENQSNPQYFEALKTERVLTISDVYRDKRTMNFQGYFNELGIKSLLDIKIGYGSGFSGVVCFETCQGTKFWQEDEMAFALRIVDIISFVIEADKRNKSEIALKESENALIQTLQAKDRFFSILAHDLKNPYNAIVGFAELLNREYDSYSDEEKKVILGNIYSSARNTYKLLENLLEWSGIQTGTVLCNPEFTDVSLLINENIRLLKPQADLKNIIIASEVSYNTQVWVDSNMINTVLRNLISNAIHYSYPDSKVKISAVKTTRDNLEYIQIKVSDKGMGIKSDNMNRLFKLEEKFHTDGTFGEKGTGLGLVLCREFIHLNHGFIWAESIEQAGSDFYVLLPVKQNN